MMLKWKVTLIGIVLCMGKIWAQDAYIVRFDLNEGMKKYLRANEFDITGVSYQTNEIEALLTSDELAKISAQKSAKLKYAFPQNLMASPDEEYKNPNEVADFVYDIHAKYPQITSVKVIGNSIEGREILAIKISKHPEQEGLKPAILINAMHHAREVMTPEVAFDMIEYLTSNYGHDSNVTKWVNSTEIWIVPMFNVDGNNRVWTENSMWRKNTRNGYGVDINRNYPTGWNSCNGSSSYTSAQDYRGTSPASEPETQSMMNLVSKIKPVFNISYHSYSEIVIYPFGCRPNKTPTTEAVELIGAEIGKKLNYRPGTAWELLYNADGGDIDWMYTEHQVIPYVIELNSISQGFHPSYKKWRDITVQRNRPGWMHLLDRLHGPSLQGVVDINSYKKIIISRPGKSEVLQTYRINPNGSFYIILKEGFYDFTFEGSKTKKITNIKIDSKIMVSF